MRPFRDYVILIIFLIIVVNILFFLVSCYNPSTKELENLTDILNRADRKSCIYYTGSAAPYLSIHGITSLGNVDFNTCVKYQ